MLPSRSASDDRQTPPRQTKKANSRARCRMVSPHAKRMRNRLRDYRLSIHPCRGRHCHSCLRRNRHHRCRDTNADPDRRSGLIHLCAAADGDRPRHHRRARTRGAAACGRPAWAEPDRRSWPARRPSSTAAAAPAECCRDKSARRFARAQALTATTGAMSGAVTQPQFQLACRCREIAVGEFRKEVAIAGRGVDDDGVVPGHHANVTIEPVARQ